MAGYIELTNENFDAVVKEGVSLVDFWAPWCGPCRMIAPVIDELAGEYAGKANICKVNTDEQEELSARYGIRSIPTILIMKNGEIKDTLIGATTKAVLVEKLNAFL
ncbi:thioredoxin [Helicobacter saguini]|uniref:Thioredoxin n=1 Tax=Helicobacter saguini TaxID=1548018 RepID=A0A347VRN4_9HELI|nr:thioredoxin [Helicobacter saguini]MWV62839.1 thioredoxin [Helicobacter saguini]MWV66492.1 thioredoxin [Helicobacter saguini]MWV68841.1 thioredoxin [Helicobacter saguini]MWV71604.1 thioredoxin [Helicobacter saguini]TLD94408.1 thioredoxin [Helicobacter saguini]